MVVFFVDTNIFLQCRAIEDLPWQDVSEGENILILISRPVQEEVDRFKQEGNSRRAKRARKASSYFRELLLAEDSKKIIRESSPRIEIAFSSIPSTTRHYEEILDLSRADDRIIHEALDLAENNPNYYIQLLTHDTNPMLTAKRCRLAYKVIPDEWLLAPEPDHRDRKITELEGRLKKIEKSCPEIKVVARDDDNNLLSSLTIELTTYERLPDDEIEQLVGEARNRSPLVTKFDESPNKLSSVTASLQTTSTVNHAFGITITFKPPSDSEVEKYTDVAYPEWLSDIRKFFKELHQNLEMPSRITSFAYSLDNLGNFPAENILIEFRALGGVCFGFPTFENEQQEKVKDESLNFPEPPLPPKGKWVQETTNVVPVFDKFGGLNSLFSSTQDTIFGRDGMKPIDIHQLRQKDRHAFYWKPHKPSFMSDVWTLECQEFRHQVNSKIFNVTLMASPKRNSENGAIKCLVTAKNLPKPVEGILPVKLVYHEGNTKKKAEEYMEEVLPRLPSNI